MLKKISMIAAAGAFMMIASSAQAFTPAPLNLPTDELAGIEHVAGGCGPGWYRGAYGRCRPMGARGVVVGRPVVVCRSVRTPYGWRRVCR
jgi:hypothetical protein